MQAWCLPERSDAEIRSRPYRGGLIWGCKVGGDLGRAGATRSQHLRSSHPGKKSRQPRPLPNLGRGGSKPETCSGPRCCRCRGVDATSRDGGWESLPEPAGKQLTPESRPFIALLPWQMSQPHPGPDFLQGIPGCVLGAARNCPSLSQPRSQALGPPRRLGTSCLAPPDKGSGGVWCLMDELCITGAFPEGSRAGFGVFGGLQDECPHAASSLRDTSMG